jgi:nitric oxide reductase large subunit
VYIALLKFDFFFIFGSQLQLLLAVGEIDDDFIINAAMVPIAIVALFLAARFCRNEKTKSMAIPIVSLFCFYNRLLSTS